jgi:hypothetical protein
MFLQFRAQMEVRCNQVWAECQVVQGSETKVVNLCCHSCSHCHDGWKQAEQDELFECLSFAEFQRITQLMAAPVSMNC